jgi:uncharacterized protein
LGNSSYRKENMADWHIIDAHVMLGAEPPLALEAGELLRRMDACGIERAVARPMGAELAVDNRTGNDRVLGAGPRIGGWVSANPWYGKRALDELQRCRQAGALGLFLHPSRQGFMPTDPLVIPLLEFAVEAGWPVMFHTGTYIQSDVLAVAEVARSYPEMPLVLGSGGFADMWFEVPSAMRDVPNLWLETSSTLGDGIRTVLREAGPERIIFGSGEPLNRCGAARKKLDRLDLTPSVGHVVFGENARRLFDMPGRSG